MYLISALLVGNVLLRFLTNNVGVLPRVLNLSDVMVTAVFVVLFLFRRNTYKDSTSTFGWRLFLFGLIVLVGAVLNSDSIYVPAALAQFVMLSEPIVLFVCLRKMPVSLVQVGQFSRILRALILIEFGVGLAQVPIFLATGNSEAMVGTFSGNAEQFTGFLLLGVCYYLGVRNVTPGSKRKYTILILGLLLLIPLVDNKASWLGMFAAICFLLLKLGQIAANRLRYVVALVSLLLIGYVIVETVSPTLGKFSVLNEAWESGNITNLGKIKAYQDIFAAFGSDPYMILVGSGPGTFYSRAAQQFYIVTSNFFYNPAAYLASRHSRTSNSMDGVITPTAAIEPFYKRFYITRKIFSIGTDQIDSPFASYAGLLGETGVLGMILYMGFYRSVFKFLNRYFAECRNDPKIFPLLTASLGFLVYTAVVSLYNPWLETGRMSTILWAGIAIVWHYQKLQENEKETNNTSDRVTPAAMYRAEHCNATAPSS